LESPKFKELDIIAVQPFNTNLLSNIISKLNIDVINMDHCGLLGSNKILEGIRRGIQYELTYSKAITGLFVY